MTILRTTLFFCLRHQTLLLYLCALAVTLISIASRVLFNGMVFEFDYHLYHPDGAAYTYMALKYAGASHLEASQEVLAWYGVNAKPGTSFDMTFFSKDDNPIVWGLAQTRVVYPLLSAPFVLLFGIKGMLVVPIISFFLLSIFTMELGRVTRNLPLALGIVFIITTSTSVSRWYIANITDGLLATILAASLLVVIRLNHSTWSLFLLGLLVVMGSFTRFSLPYWFGLAIFLILRGARPLAIVVSVVSILSFIPTFLNRPGSESFVAGAQGDGLARALYLPISASRVLFIEISQLVALDRSLLLLISAALIVSLVRWKQVSAQVFVIMSLAGWSIGALNGVLGVNFRYQLPIVIFAAYTVLDALEFSVRFFQKTRVIDTP